MGPRSDDTARLGPHVRIPSWLVVLVVGLLMTAAGSLAALAYNAGGLVEGVREIGRAMERFDVRMQHVEQQQRAQGEDLARLKERTERPAATSGPRAR